MYWNELLARSRAEFSLEPMYASCVPQRGVFAAGAAWMAYYMRRDPQVIPAIPFGWYGALKYGLSLLAFTLSAALLFQLHPALALLSVPVFYVIEIHFLFLFPMLIDGAEAPLRRCLLQPYRLGLFHTLFTVMPIAFYMLAGLAKLRRPLYNWHIGCLAILIWYRDVSGARR